MVSHVTSEDYLRAERQAEFRSEYLGGCVFPLSGGTEAHSRLVLRVGGMLDQKGIDPCTGLRVRISSGDAYFYPDIVVACCTPRYAESEEEDTLLNPTLLIEILSDSTEQFDRGNKFSRYQTLPSLAEYVLISQLEMRIECFTRQPDGRWLYAESKGNTASVQLHSINLSLPLAEIYRNILAPGI